MRSPSSPVSLARKVTFLVLVVLGQLVERKALHQRRQQREELLVFGRPPVGLPAHHQIDGLFRSRIEKDRRGGELAPQRIVGAHAQVGCFALRALETLGGVADRIEAPPVDCRLAERLLAAQVLVEGADQCAADGLAVRKQDTPAHHECQRRHRGAERAGGLGIDDAGGLQAALPLKAGHRLVRAAGKGGALPLGLGDCEAQERQLAMQEGDIVPVLVDRM